MKFYTNVFRDRNEIVQIGYDNGEKFIYRDHFAPHFGVETNDESAPYRTIYDKPAKRIDCDSIFDWYSFRKQNQDLFPLLNNIAPEYQYIAEHYSDEIAFKIEDINIVGYDLEVISADGTFPDPEDAKWPIVSAAFKLFKTGKYVLFGMKDFDETDMQGVDFDTKSKIQYVKCLNEKDLLDKITKFWQYVSPDIITGWNIDNFDNPYLLKRIESQLGSAALCRLSHGGKPTVTMKEFMGMKEFKCVIPGVSSLDYIVMYKKNFAAEASYALNAIASKILGKTKLEFDEDMNFREMYEQDYQRFLIYNCYDVELIELLEKECGLLSSQISLAYLHKVNYEDIYSPVRSWDVLIFNDLSNNNIMIPAFDHKDKVSYAGAYVMDVDPGLYPWTMSFDINSLYPKVTIMLNVSPEKLLGRKYPEWNRQRPDKSLFEDNGIIDTDCIVAANGVAFKKDELGFGPRILDYMYNIRAKYKAEMIEAEGQAEESKAAGNMEDYNTKTALARLLDNLQTARKLSMNSFYGALANEWFRYYDVEMAEAITLTGQFVIMNVIEYVDNYFKEKYGFDDTVVYYGDTDSIYLSAKKYVDEHCKGMETAEIVNELDRLSKEEIEPVIEDAFDFAINRLNCFPDHMIMKREGIAEYCVFSSKKKYAMMLWDKEGTRYEKLKFKTKGMQMVQSSTPNILKEKLIKSVEYIMMSEDPMVLKNYLDETKKWFMTLTPDEIAFPRSANNIAKYSDSNNIYGKKCPIAVRGCLIHNHYIKQNNVDWKIIKEGEKIKFIYMNRPNPYYNSNIFSFPGKFKASHDYVDYNTQWQKSFYKTVIKLAKECGIDIESYKTISLDDIF